MARPPALESVQAYLEQNDASGRVSHYLLLALQWNWAVNNPIVDRALMAYVPQLLLGDRDLFHFEDRVTHVHSYAELSIDYDEDNPAETEGVLYVYNGQATPFELATYRVQLNRVERRRVSRRQRNNEALATAVLMGAHPRLGRDSWLRHLPAGVLERGILKPDHDDGGLLLSAGCLERRIRTRHPRVVYEIKLHFPSFKDAEWAVIGHLLAFQRGWDEHALSEAEVQALRGYFLARR